MHGAGDWPAACGACARTCPNDAAFKYDFPGRTLT